ncbi:MAG: S49 family peptidase [Balneolales bacterium]
MKTMHLTSIADMMVMDPLAEREREGLVRRLNELYEDFITKVAEYEIEEVREIAEGRIWTGE